MYRYHTIITRLLPGITTAAVLAGYVRWCSFTHDYWLNIYIWKKFNVFSQIPGAASRMGPCCDHERIPFLHTPSQVLYPTTTVQCNTTINNCFFSVPLHAKSWKHQQAPIIAPHTTYPPMALCCPYSGAYDTTKGAILSPNQCMHARLPPPFAALQAGARQDPTAYWVMGSSPFMKTAAEPSTRVCALCFHEGKLYPPPSLRPDDCASWWQSGRSRLLYQGSGRSTLRVISGVLKRTLSLSLSRMRPPRDVPPTSASAMLTSPFTVLVLVPPSTRVIYSFWLRRRHVFSQIQQKTPLFYQKRIN